MFENEHYYKYRRNMRAFRYTNRFKEDLANMLDSYCESLSDREFEWLVSGLHDKLKDYLKDIIVEL